MVASSGKGSVLTIPSDIGAGSLRELTRLRGGSGQQVRLDPGEYVLEVDGSSAFVGTLALEQSAQASTARGDVSRYWTGHTLQLLMVLAGTLIKAPNFNVRIVTGLPVKVWDNESTVPQVQRSLCGTHQFVLNRRPRVMHVEGVMVVMEGAGNPAAFAFLTACCHWIKRATLSGVVGSNDEVANTGNAETRGVFV